MSNNPRYDARSPAGEDLRAGDELYDDIVAWLTALDGVPQNPKYHPEGDALFHSLQVFELALAERAEPALLAAALLHDIGKAYAGRDHDKVGADMLAGWEAEGPHPDKYGLPERTVWLVEHHLDLLRDPRATRARWLGSAALQDLERLRRWDLGGRKRYARVREPEEAAAIVVEALAELADAQGTAPDTREHV